MHIKISSLQNPLVKQVIQLTEKSRERKKQQLFVIEGQREISLALQGGYRVTTLLFSSEIASNMEISEIKKHLHESVKEVEISKEVYEKLAYRGSTEGMLAIAKTKDLSLKNLKLTNAKPLILIAEAPEKPGNIGALLRTADAAGLDAVIIANPRADVYNPNILRSSVGCVFTNNVVTGETHEIISYLKNRNINLYSAVLQSSISYTNCDFKNASAIVVGTESIGLSQEWRQQSTQNVEIPMHGKIDSMNVSVAAGILIFEAKRQRGF